MAETEGTRVVSALGCLRQTDEQQLRMSMRNLTFLCSQDWLPEKFRTHVVWIREEHTNETVPMACQQEMDSSYLTYQSS